MKDNLRKKEIERDEHEAIEDKDSRTKKAEAVSKVEEPVEDPKIEPVVEVEMANSGEIKAVNKYIEMFEKGNLKELNEFKDKSSMRKIATAKANKAIENPESYGLSKTKLEQLQGFVE
jgi:hypothetical protein